MDNENETEYQFHLNGAGMCKRGVRVVELDVNTIQRLESQLLAKLTAEAEEKDEKPKGMDLRRVFLVAVTKKMVVAVTEPVDKLTTETPWRRLTDLEKETQWATLFRTPTTKGTKDHAMLAKVYEHLHEVDQSDVDAILGKGLAVVSGG